MKTRIYLAGPDVFEPNAIEIGREKKATCEAYGFEGAFPLDNEIPNFDQSKHTGLRIGAANEALMDSCDVIAANMTPWHGPGMDTGTAFEMGYMRAQKKFILAYTDDMRPFSNRVLEHFKMPLPEKESTSLIDPRGKLIENFGKMTDNLMMIHATESSSGQVFPTLEQALSYLKSYLPRH